MLELIVQEFQALTRDLERDAASNPQWFLRERGGPRIRPAVVFAELEDTLVAWQELRASAWVHEAQDKLITSEWTLKDLLAHIASWETEFVNQIETALRRADFDYTIIFSPKAGPKEWNDQQVGRRRERTLDENFDEIESGTRRLQDLALELPADIFSTPRPFPIAFDSDPRTPWTLSAAQMMLTKCMHDRHHLARIENFRSSIGH
jgi:mycothiol maleylpyruvate isomerase-like protein